MQRKTAGIERDVCGLVAGGGGYFVSKITIRYLDDGTPICPNSTGISDNHNNNSPIFKMAAESHWVNEVFPVKFSINDLLGDGEADLASLEPNLKIKHSYRDACNRLIVNEERSSLAKEAVGLHLNRGEIQSKHCTHNDLIC